MWTLVICISIKWGMCSSIDQYEYNSYEMCMENRKSMIESKQFAYVVCTPRIKDKDT